MENTEKTAKQLLEELDSSITNSETPRYIELTIHDGVGASATMGGEEPPEHEYEDIEEEDLDNEVEEEEEDNNNLTNY